MLNFNTNIQEIVATQETTKRTTNFTEFTSKKKLFETNILTEEQKSHIQNLKGTFTFHLHSGKRYVVITMYYSRTKTYGFLILDLETLLCAEADSVKNAKREVMEIVSQNSPTVETTVEEVPQKKAKKNK